MRNVLSTLLLCLVACYCFGQKDDKGRNLPNGLRIGYQYSNLVNDDETAADNLDRFYVGYVRKINLIPLIHLETGLEYMMAGAQQSEISQLQLQYLVIPVQGVVKIGPFVGLAGVNGNFRLAEKLTLNGQTIDRSGDDKSAAFDLAVDAGVGFNILFVTIEARYYWGLLEVDHGWYNQYWQAGLKFHF